MTGDCVFCAILAGEIPASVVHEDDETIAFLDVAPITPGHALVIPRVHAADLRALPPDAGAAVFRSAMHVAQALRSSGLRADGVNLILSDGAAAGQDVPHVHLHVVPRFAGDGLRIQATHGSPAREELEETAAAIRAARPPAS